eukprot:TRINITY_DN15944_c0_g1_i1.p1 TRINITY_DN15944_c0_g1~~TRINITY_DN15944_c0_g1_i1.p1  ORF type:complete len:403 (+),score=126.99 TRINITY_DN15944_c0_g1_i1:88-1296(+)
MATDGDAPIGGAPCVASMAELLSLDLEAAEGVVVSLRDDMLRLENFPSARYVGSLANALREIRLKARDPTEASAMTHQVFSQLDPFLNKPDAVMTKDAHGMMLEWYRDKTVAGSPVKTVDLPPPLPSGPIASGGVGAHSNGITSAEVISEYYRMAHEQNEEPPSLSEAVEAMQELNEGDEDAIEMLMDEYDDEGSPVEATPEGGEPSPTGEGEQFFERRIDSQATVTPATPADDDVEAVAIPPDTAQSPPEPGSPEGQPAQEGSSGKESPSSYPPLPPIPPGATSPHSEALLEGEGDPNDIEEISLEASGGAGTPQDGPTPHPPGCLEEESPQTTPHGTPESKPVVKGAPPPADGEPEGGGKAERGLAEEANGKEKEGKKGNEKEKGKEKDEHKEGGCCVIL